MRYATLTFETVFFDQLATTNNLSPIRMSVRCSLFTCFLILLAFAFLSYKIDSTLLTAFAERLTFFTSWQNKTVEAIGYFKCKLPILDPWDRQIQKHLKHPRKIDCVELQPYLSAIDSNNRLFLNKSQFAALNIVEPSDYKCWFIPFDRGNGTNDDKIVERDRCEIKLGETKTIPTDQVYVNCNYANSTKLYTNVHALVPDRKTKKRERNTELSVFLFTIDSLSSSMFDRSLPLTRKFLFETMGFHRLKGFNRAGKNSTPNMGIVLTGLRYANESLEMQNELEEVKSHTYDHWPLIWKNFSAKGYVTALIEDQPQYGLFNYLANGFSKVPTDHYYRPWQLAMRRSKLAANSSSYCFGNEPKPFLLIDLMDKIVTKYKDNPYFLFSFSNEPSHDTQTDLERLDDYLLKFFRKHHEKNSFNHTVIFLIGDHGPRWGSIRSTIVGRIEENLNHFSVWFPKWFFDKYPNLKENLKANEMTLSSHFDTHRTLQDVLEENFSCSHKPSSGRGLTQICRLPERSCFEAGSKYPAGIPINHEWIAQFQQI